MKKYTYLLIIALISIYTNIQAQHCSQTINTVTTDWRSTAGGNTNTFDWTRNIYSGDVWIADPDDPNNVDTDIPSPFYDDANSSDNEQFFNVYYWFDSNDADPVNEPNVQHDIFPEQGWELLTLDMGNSLLAANNPSFSIYNRHRGIIRFFVYITFAPPNANVGFITLTINQNYKNNALLTFSEPISQPLVNFTPGLVVSFPQRVNNSGSLSSATGYWMYADFPVAYDPCVCQKDNNDDYLFTSQIQFDVVQVDNASVDLDVELKLNGEITGTIKELVAKKEDSELTLGSLISKIGDGYKSFTKTAKTVTDFGTMITKLDTKQKSQSDEGKSSLSIANVIAAQFDLGWLAKVFKGPAGTILGGGTGLINFLTTGEKTQSVTPQQVDLKVTGDISGTINGTITTSTLNLVRSTETPSTNDGQLTSKKLYNNILGVFNVLEMPTMEYAYYTNISHPSDDNYSVLQTKLKNPIKYVINPAANLTPIKIVASIVIKTKDASLTRVSKISDYSIYNDPVNLTCEYYNGTETCNMLAPPFTIGQFGTIPGEWAGGNTLYEKQVSAAGLEIHNWVEESGCPYDIDEDLRGTLQLNTPYVGISQLENMSFLIPKNLIADTEFNLKIIAFFKTPDNKVVQLVTTYVIDKDEDNINYDNDYTYKIVDEAGTTIADIYTDNCLDGWIDIYKLQPDKYVDLLTYRTDYFIVPIDASPFTTVNGNYYPTNINMDGETITTTGDYYAWNNITLNDVIIDNSATVNFYAGNEIDVTGESDLGSTSSLNIGSLPSLLPDVIAPITDAVTLTNFCNSQSGYKGRAESRLANPETTTNPKRPYNTFELFPNPFKGTTNMRFSFSEGTTATIRIMDIAGKVLGQPFNNRSYPIGTHTYEYDASALAPGIYFCELATPNGSQTVKMVVE